MAIYPLQHGVKEVANITFYDLTSGDAVLFFDTLKVSNLEFTGDTVYARGGKGNPKLIAWDSNREIMLNMQDALISVDMLAFMAGSTTSVGVKTIYYTGTHVQTSDAGTTAVMTVAGITAAGTVVTAEHYDASAGTTTDVSGSTVLTTDTITVTATLDDGDRVFVSATLASAATAETVTFAGDAYPGTYKIVADTLIKDTDGTNHAYQFVIYKAKLQPGFTMTMEAEGDPSVFDFTLDVLANDSGNMIELIKY